ncbi:MAG: IS21-like element helper ATPase IstB [Pseudomonadota bacterium]|nr:IS21-like element helper ATPase IstB [Pseudomonadota bacterium]
MTSPILPPSTLEGIHHHLVGLKMPLALEQLDAVLRQLEQGELSALEAIETLLGQELMSRETRRIKMGLTMARLTPIKSLDTYDFSFQPTLDRNRILALAELGFVQRKEVVHFLGPPGTGKSHLAISLGVEAVKAGNSVYFTSLAEVTASLAKAEREGTLMQRVRFLARHGLLIIDEIGYLPLAANGANLFFHLVNACYEHTAMILTSNRGFAEWGEVFGDLVVATALLDRLLHHAIVIQIDGNSYRLKHHAAMLPEGLLHSLHPFLTSSSPGHRGRPAKDRK